MHSFASTKVLAMFKLADKNLLSLLTLVLLICFNIISAVAQGTSTTTNSTIDVVVESLDYNKTVNVIDTQNDTMNQNETTDNTPINTENETSTIITKNQNNSAITIEVEKETQNEIEEDPQIIIRNETNSEDDNKENNSPSVPIIDIISNEYNKFDGLDDTNTSYNQANSDSSDIHDHSDSSDYNDTPLISMSVQYGTIAAAENTPVLSVSGVIMIIYAIQTIL